MRLRRIAISLASLLALTACGESTGTESTGGAAPSAEAGTPSLLPDVEVADVAAGETVNLRSFLPADRPLLIWFWAPH